MVVSDTGEESPKSTTRCPRDEVRGSKTLKIEEGNKRVDLPTIGERRRRRRDHGVITEELKS